VAELFDSATFFCLSPLRVECQKIKSSRM